MTNQATNPYHFGQAVTIIGRLILAGAFVSFGLELLLTGNFPLAFLPSQQNFEGKQLLVVLVGFGVLVAGVCLGGQRKTEVVLKGMGTLFLAGALGIQVPALAAQLTNGSLWTVTGELAALGGGCFYITINYEHTKRLSRLWSPSMQQSGKWLWLMALIIFGALHFIYAPFIATLVPRWIAVPLFWAYFVGIVFWATALSWLIDRLRSLSASLLGLMFLLWVALVHAPRVVQSPNVEPEWTSMLIALALGGIALQMAGVPHHAAEKFDVDYSYRESNQW